MTPKSLAVFYLVVLLSLSVSRAALVVPSFTTLVQKNMPAKMTGGGNGLDAHHIGGSSGSTNATLPWIPNSVKNGMASGMAAAVVKTLLQPFDTVKTMMQAQRGRIGPLGAMRDVVSKRGVPGLWSGLGVTVIGSAPSVAIYFGCYSHFKTRFSTLIPEVCSFICSCYTHHIISSLFRSCLSLYPSVFPPLTAPLYTTPIPPLARAEARGGGTFGNVRQHHRVSLPRAV
jgi:hypothetical protein